VRYIGSFQRHRSLRDPQPGRYPYKPEFSISFVAPLDDAFESTSLYCYVRFAVKIQTFAIEFLHVSIISTQSLDRAHQRRHCPSLRPTQPALEGW
jgi:hypothetical protein